MLTQYNMKSVKNINGFKNLLEFDFCFMYNRQCWSLTAMMREVADTPGRFAMAGESGDFRGECLFIK